jgi:hypothetical protein
VLARLGRLEAAHAAVSHCLAERWERLGPDLNSGLPGFALVLDHLGATLDEPSYSEAAWRAADIVSERSANPDARPGLLHGGAGRALMYIRLYERTGDGSLLDRAAAELRADLAGCVMDRNGGLNVDEGWRMMPYLGVGSVGIGLVIDEYLALRPDGEDGEFAEARDAIRITASSRYYAQPTLFAGRAGMILYLAGHDRDDPMVARHVRDLAWHALPYGGGLAMPGEHLYRLSMDLATGTAGVLLALGAALDGRPGLPFLGTAHVPPVDSPTAATSTQPERG